MAEGVFDRPGEEPDRPREPVRPDVPRRPAPWEDVEGGVIGRLVEAARRRDASELGDAAAGRWIHPPRRHHGDEVNARYEAWVREETGGLAGAEYEVIGPDGKAVLFDSRALEIRDGERVEVLIDAKGRYAQFLDEDGEWYDFYAESVDGGVPGMIRPAKEQVGAADGRPVQWWCLQAEVATALNEEFGLDPGLKGRIEVVHRPMPNQEVGV